MLFRGRRAPATIATSCLFLISSALTPPAAAQQDPRREAEERKASQAQAPATHAEEGEMAGVAWTGEPGITETVAEIMERERVAPKVDASAGPRVTKPEIEYRRLQLLEEPASGAMSRWPSHDQSLAKPYNPQAVGTSFLAAQVFPDSGFIPPDSMGDVGPSQILVAVNGRVRVFNKTGTVGGLDVSTNNFFASVTGGSGTSDPRVRYDRLSGRWFVTMITVPSQGPNRILIAVSSGPAITNSSSFTFFQFQQDVPGGAPGNDVSGFADYDSLGVDKFALYIGVNMFNQTGTAFVGTTGFVVRKASLLAGSLVVTAFRGMAGNSCPGPGPYSPQGVNNDDPSATEGYFIGVDNCSFSLLQIRRVSNPGSTSPSLGPNLTVAVAQTRFPIDQVQPGTSAVLDALDDRLFSAAVRKNKVTGASTLWAAHNMQVDATGAAIQCGSFGDPTFPLCPNGRNGSRWYQIGSLTTTPALVQFDTVFDSGATNPLGHWMPSVNMSGQGHMAIGTSRAGASAANGFASIVAAGRLRTDTLNTTQSPTVAQSSSSSYDLGSQSPRRWGDYSQVSVDPNDDMTFWTFQEYANATNSWGVQAIQLRAAGPATPTAASPSTVCSGLASVPVSITGTSSAGSEFFDPGADSGGPGFLNHVAGTVTGVPVNSATFVDPTHVTLNLNTVGATAGAKNVTITNPDGQQAVGSSLLTVQVTATPVASNNGPICAGATLQLNATGSGTFSWTGPNGFTSTLQNPSIPAATVAASGTYTVTVTAGGCTSAPATTVASVVAPPTATVSGDQTICTGASTSVVATLTGSGPWTLNWSPDSFVQVVSSSPAMRTVSPAVTTTYSLSSVATGVCTGTASGSATITIDPSANCGSFVPVTPCRLVDTRGAQGPALANGTTRSFDAGGQCGVPLNAKAVAIILAAVNETNTGNLRLFPAGAAAPSVSTINFTPGVTRTNNAIIPLGTAGQVSVLTTIPAGGSTDFIMDVTGYFQ